MPLTIEDERIWIKRSTVSGQVPTLAPSTDHTDGTWTALDIYEAEVFFNTANGRAYTRMNNTIREFLVKPIGATTGDLFYVNTSGTLSRLAIGTSGYVVQSNGTIPVYAPASDISTDINVGVTPITGGTNGLVPFNDGGVYGEDSALYWDKTNNKLSIGGDATPNYGITLASNALAAGGMGLNQTSFDNNIPNYNGTSPSDWNLESTTVGVIQPGTTGNGVLQVVGITDANSSGLQLHGLTPTTAAGGGVAVYAGKITGADTVVDVPAAERFLTLKTVSGGTIISSFNGRGGLYLGGTTIPSANLHVSGSASGAANTASIKLDSGTLLAGIENGTVEYDGTHLYISIGGVRYQVDQQGASGTFTPTLTAGSNVTTVTNQGAHYMRVGSTVNVVGACTITCTLALGTDSKVQISLPIASNFGTVYQAVGGASSRAAAVTASTGATIVGNTASDVAELSFSSNSVTPNVWAYWFQYQII